ncbi:hypothetical protein [Haloprofundus salilacus]|uniref:hypothetical protein n=1 Tax=Haloprofundus salilacus TaxID=2876190 RepID=UPI001CD02939|nr:hypothetical protein [Haloprofundus salilacus]
MDALREFIEGRVPNEWVRTPGAVVAFERNGLRVEAVQTTTPQRFGRRWEIRRLESAGEATGRETVQYVSSREEALEAVYDCMCRVGAGETASDGGYVTTDEYATGEAAHSDAATPSIRVKHRV